MKKYKTLVLTGRFQPVHIAHVELIKRACALAEQLIIIIGSDRQPRTYKNPWKTAEREGMLRAAIAEIDIQSCDIVIEKNHDTLYNTAAWIARTQAIVARYNIKNVGIAIIGHDKDSTTSYLGMFPQWAREEIPLIEPLNATDIRSIYFRRDANVNFLQGVISPPVLAFLKAFMETYAYDDLVKEREFVDKYQQQYASYPYPPIFVTVDAVVVQSGHILMVQRGGYPGRGLWALPGGFVNANTDASIIDATIRELREETRIKVPVPVLLGSMGGIGNLKPTKVFDAINRSSRGRTITHASYFELADGTLAKIKAADDARSAKWIPLASVDPETCFEDHYAIIEHFVGSVLD